FFFFFFFSSRRRHTRSYGDWSSDVCSSDLTREALDEFPVSDWEDCDEVLRAASEAFQARWINDWLPEKRHDVAQFAAFLDEYARSEERRVGKECRSRWSRYQ